MMKLSDDTAGSRQPGDIVFPGTAANNNRFDLFLRENFGYEATRVNNDWVIPENDRELSRGPRDILKVHREIELDHDAFQKTAEEMASFIPSDYDEYRPAVPEGVRFAGGFGDLSTVDKFTIELALSPRKDVVSLLGNTILPFVSEKMKANKIAPITVDAKYYQSVLSLIKIVFLLKIHGPLELEKLLKRKVLWNILPDPLGVLSYVDAFTILSPRALTLSVSYHGCGWHFYRDNGWIFPHGATESFLDQFQGNLHPRSSVGNLSILEGLGAVSADDTWRFLRLIALAINALQRFLMDPRSFRQESGEVDFLRQIQAFSAINLIIADIKSLNLSTGAHNRTSYAISALDKIANLRREFGAQKLSEGKVMQGLLSLSQSGEIRRTIRRQVGVRWPQLSRQLSASTRAFAEFHRPMRNELGKNGIRESARLKRFGAYRNLNHGTFLTGDQFEALFLHSEGSIPPMTPSIALLSSLALMLEPARFLNFQPCVRW